MDRNTTVIRYAEKYSILPSLIPGHIHSKLSLCYTYSKLYDDKTGYYLNTWIGYTIEMESVASNISEIICLTPAELFELLEILKKHETFNSETFQLLLKIQKRINIQP